MTVHLSWRRYALPFRHAVRTAHGVWSTREGVLVQLSDATGATGWGEAAPIPHFGHPTVDQLEDTLRRVGDQLAHPRAWREIPQIVGPLAFAFASAETELAAAARGSGDGDARGNAPVDPDRNTWPMAGLLPAGKAALAEIRTLLEAGFRTFKWKVGVLDPADELTLLDDLLSALPDRARLRLDANGAWDRRLAERWLDRCADRPIEFVEQPIAPSARGADDLLLGLAHDYPTPIGLDESLIGAEDIRKWRGLGWPGVWVLKLAFCHDPEAVLAEFAKANADVVFSSALETKLGAIAGLRHAFTWTGKRRALGYGVWPLFADARFDGPSRAPYVRFSDLSCNSEALWTALT